MSLDSSGENRHGISAILANEAHYRPIIIDLNRVYIKDHNPSMALQTFAALGSFTDQLTFRNSEISNSTSLTSILQYVTFNSIIIENVTFTDLSNNIGAALTLTANIVPNLTNVNFENYESSSFTTTSPIFMTHIPFSALFLNNITIEN